MSGKSEQNSDTLSSMKQGSIALLGAALTLVLLLFMLWQGSMAYEDNLLADQKFHVEAQIVPYSNSLSYIITHNVAHIESMEEFVNENPSKDNLDRNFQTFASGFQSGSPEIRMIRLFPVSNEEYIYPQSCNETPGCSTFDDLVTDDRPYLYSAVQETIQSGDLVVTDPYELQHGDVAMMAVKAIYINDSLWGIAVISMDFTSLVEVSGMNNAKDGLALSLKDSSGRLLLGSSEISREDPLINVVSFPGGNWELAAVPDGGWSSSIEAPLGIFQKAGLVIVLLLTLLSYIALNKNLTLREEVKERTDSLTESESRYHQLFDSNSDSLFLIDKNGRIFDANKVAEERYGYSREQLLKMDASDLSPLHVRDRKYPLKEIMDKGAQFQCTHVHKDGTEFPVDINASPIVLNAQTYILISVRDITKSKEIENALIESENRYRLLTDTARDFIIVHDLQGRLLYANKTAVEFSGYSEKDFLSKNVTEFVSPEEYDKMSERKRHRLEDDSQTYLYETNFIDKDGNAIPVEVSSVFMEDSDLKSSILIVARDITKRKMTESALLKSEEMFATVFNTVPDSIMLTSFDGNIINVNEGFLKNEGYEIDELLGSSIFYLTLWPDPDICKQYIDQLNSHKIVRNFETDIYSKKGDMHSVIISGDIITTDSEKYILTVFRDVTELKNTENELKKSKFLLDEVSEIANIGGWEFDASTGKGTWTPQVAKIYGLEGDGPVSKDFGLSFFVSESKEIIENAIKKAIEEAQPYDLELEMVSSDGINKWVRTLARPVIKNGKVVKITGSMQDITERKLAANKLLESEVRVKKKLRTIMEPDGDLAELELADIVDIEAIQELVAGFYQLANIGGMAIIDLKGDVLVAIGWQDICTKFHRVHPETCMHCIESDLELTKGVEPGTCRFYKCKNGMWDMVTPIVIGGSHLGNLFVGQFFLEDEEIPYDMFKLQAKKYGFDEKEYLEAVERIPHWSRETVELLMSYYSNLTNLVSTLSYSNIKLARILNERDELLTSLRDSEERFRATFEQAAVGMCQVDLNGVLIQMNQRFCDISGYTQEELTQMSFADLTLPEDLDKESFLIEDLVSGKIRDYSIEKPLICKDGRLLWVNVTVGVVRSSDNEPLYFISLIEDIDTRKQAEAGILQYTERLNMLHDIDTGIISSTSSEDIANSVLKNLRELISCPIIRLRMIDHETNDSLVLAMNSEYDSAIGVGTHATIEDSSILDILKSGSSVIISDLSSYESHNTELITKFKNENIHSVLIVPLIIEGELMGVLTLSSFEVDFFTEEHQTIVEEVANQLAIAVHHSHLNDQIRKHADELEKRVVERTSQLEAANKELEAFTYSVSHDLRAPLRAIDGFSRMIIEDYGSLLDDEGKRFLDVIRTNTQKMDRLITDLLVLSRVGRSGMNYLLINMNEMVSSAFNDLTLGEEKNNIALNVGELPDSYADPTLAKQMWTNLLSNAIKYSSTRDQSVIEVGAYTKDGMNIYYVQDNGVGFNPDYSHKLFGIFQRLHSDKEFPGTGVGLAIVERIAKRHEGDVWARSELDKGATFYFSLPVRDEEYVHGE